MTQPDYTAIELKVEADMVRTELEPVPRSWHLNQVGPVYTADMGCCCLLSPQLLGTRVRRDDGFMGQIAKVLGVSWQWVRSATQGFDGHSTFGTSGTLYDAWQFGNRMRLKYVREANQ